MLTGIACEEANRLEPFARCPQNQIESKPAIEAEVLASESDAAAKNSAGARLTWLSSTDGTAWGCRPCWIILTCDAKAW